jgi:serine/threonine-protein kinase
VAELLEYLAEDLKGKYAIERELGRGGMATVFLATDLEADRKVALKVLDPDLAVAMGARRFQREFQITLSLTHPNILPVYDSGEAADSLYYVMPYVTGDSLRKRLQTEKQLPIEEALRITIDLASALEFAHQKGVIHRDIKPENVLFDESGRAILADFGIARAISSMGNETKLTQTGLTLGTAAYMSPEQGAAEPHLDGRSDLYSLACVTYEMLVGEPPFTGASSMTIMARHAMEEPPSLTVVRPTIDDDVEDIVLRALSKSPADRYATVGDYAEALQACLTTGRTTTRRIPGDRRATPRRGRGAQLDKAKRSRRRMMIGALAIVPLVAASAAVAWRANAGNASAASPEEAALLRRVAVLYFDDATPDNRLTHLADGLTEALIAELRQVSGLSVVSENGVAPFREADVSRDSIARALDVGLLATGSLEEVKDKLRVTVRLVDGQSGVEIRSRAFEQPTKDLLAIRDTVAHQVALFLRQRLGEEINLRELKAGTENASAWSLLFRARRARKDAEVAMQEDDEATAQQRFALADSLLDQAARLDARWPTPHTERATLAYRRARLAHEPADAATSITSGLTHAERALALAPTDPDALEARGTLRYLRWLLRLTPDSVDRSRLLAEAKADLDRAVQINPSQASAWSVLSHLHAQKPDFTEVKIAARRAYDADAYLSSADVVLWRLYAASYELEQFDDAKRWCAEGGRRFDGDPRFIQCQLWLMTTRAEPPDVPRAWQLLEELRDRTPSREWEYQRREGQMLVAAALARAQLADSARRVLERSRAEAEIDPGRDLLSIEAFVRTLLPDSTDRAESLRLLGQYLAVNPEHREGMTRDHSWWWRDLRNDPRFQKLVSGTS